MYTEMQSTETAGFPLYFFSIFSQCFQYQTILIAEGPLFKMIIKRARESQKPEPSSSVCPDCETKYNIKLV